MTGNGRCSGNQSRSLQLEAEHSNSQVILPPFAIPSPMILPLTGNCRTNPAADALWCFKVTCSTIMSLKIFNVHLLRTVNFYWSFKIWLVHFSAKSNMQRDLLWRPPPPPWWMREQLKVASIRTTDTAEARSHSCVHCNNCQSPRTLCIQAMFHIYCLLYLPMHKTVRRCLQFACQSWTSFYSQQVSDWAGNCMKIHRHYVEA